MSPVSKYIGDTHWGALVLFSLKAFEEMGGTGIELRDFGPKNIGMKELSPKNIGKKELSPEKYREEGHEFPAPSGPHIRGHTEPTRRGQF